jgi:hypothetical protein
MVETSCSREHDVRVAMRADVVATKVRVTTFQCQCPLWFKFGVKNLGRCDHGGTQHFSEMICVLGIVSLGCGWKRGVAGACSRSRFQRCCPIDPGT